ncbi:MBL fold metallo-hydrolase [Pseudonocardia abyssalis]|uniref:MBL fold metallo-hydrolase n=1 Tax=Pseudonocardia abyssalis TaxID=2792008 RepID=A0ABS6USW0_9PSEU|nr:MBL fold metallo-hydrolase [Pseudonocardia abyssalis]MBW0115360.1 MBL fold metallo-hydrolase [Pseudonocardia abyssalis]MBW0135339.1 MBL fold metallo-hydrolase [Pseudonocardia abyssalis]
MILDDDPDGDWTGGGPYRCAPDVYRIPLPLPQDGLRAVNVYAIPDGDGWTLIDSGWALAESRELLTAALAKLGAGLGDVRRFLVTHIHRDHYTQAVALRREFGAHVALGRGEESGLAEIHRSGRDPFDAHRARLVRAGATALVATIEETRPDPGDLSVWEQPDEWIEDGAEIAVGDTQVLTAVETPGHTRGHLVFADDAAGLLFAGDHVLPRITPSIGFEPHPTTSPLAAFLTSLQLIRSRKDALLLPAHGPVGMRVHERVDALLEHHGDRLDATLAAVREGRSTAQSVAEALPWTRHRRRLPDMDAFNAMLAVLETQAHLDVLVERGAVTITLQSGVAHYTS